MPYSVLGSGCSPVDGAHDAKPFPQKQVLLVWQMPCRLQGSARGRAQLVRSTPFTNAHAPYSRHHPKGVRGVAERALLR